MGSDFKLFHQKCQLTSICGGRLFPMRGALEGNTLNGLEFKFTAILQPFHSQSYNLELCVTIEIEAGL